MKFKFDQSKESLFISFLSMAILFLIMIFFFFFDNSISTWALGHQDLATNEESTLGEFFQVVRIFGKADVLILLALVLGLAGKRRICKRMIIALILVGLIVHPVKSIVGRERPDHTSERSFPSGDTATAFILPEVLTASSASVVTSSIVASGVAVSRIFYQRHYPSDVVAGAIIGLFAGIAGIFISNKIKWLPSRNHLLIALCILTLYLAVSALANAHHRHNLQFIVWYGPALLLYLLRPYVVHAFPEISKRVISGKLYYLLKDCLYGCYILGTGAIIIPWFTGISGVRGPALSLGIVLLVYAHYALRELKVSRIGALLGLTASAMFIAQFWTFGYILGKF